MSWTPTPNAEGSDSIPGQGTRSHVLQLRILCAATKTWCDNISFFAFLFLNIFPSAKCNRPSQLAEEFFQLKRTQLPLQEKKKDDSSVF